MAGDDPFGGEGTVWCQTVGEKCWFLSLPVTDEVHSGVLGFGGGRGRGR